MRVAPQMPPQIPRPGAATASKEPNKVCYFDFLVPQTMRAHSIMEFSENSEQVESAGFVDVRQTNARCIKRSESNFNTLLRVN